MCVYMYIYIYIYHIYCSDTSVCETNTPPEEKTFVLIRLTNIKLGAGEEFLQLDCQAKAGRKGVLFSQTPVLYCIAV